MFHSKDFIGVNGCIPYSAYDQFFRECKFWKDKENKGVKQKDWCENLNQGSAYEFASKFYPHSVSFVTVRPLMQMRHTRLFKSVSRSSPSLARQPLQRFSIVCWSGLLRRLIICSCRNPIPKNLKEQSSSTTHTFCV